MKEHPVFARLYDRIAESAEGWEREYRDELCAEAPGLVLEVGAGTGLNFEHYRKAERVVAVEPEPNMLRRAVPRAAAAPVPVTLVRGSAERLPFADGSFDTLVCALVLCTVPDQHAAIAECRRVLRPDGVLRFYEHVLSPDPKAARVQRAIRRPWHFFGAGCHPDRDTPARLAGAGFHVRFRRFLPPMAVGWIMPHVIGEASTPQGPPSR
jgi:ubiquinone/menaquinone biosynthesis C-methylase UbiE